MSGFSGKTETIERVPGDIKGARSAFADYAIPRYDLLNTGRPDIEPYLKLFEQQNSRTLAQAKESAGNLTGSGLGNIIGAEAGRASTEQGAFLANLLEESKQRNSQRLASLLIPFLTAGVGAPEAVYKPGFLDYAGQLGGSVLGAAGSAGGFSRLFR